MTTLKTYKIVCFDANDVPDVITTGLTRMQARIKLAQLRIVAEGTYLRYIMKRDTPEPKYDARVGDHLWTGQRCECSADFTDGLPSCQRCGLKRVAV